MRLFYKIAVVFLIGFACNAQSDEYPYSYKQGSRFMQKAEQKIASGDYDSAEKLLAKALKADYGFCGNAWYTSHSAIHLMQARIYKERKEYEKALAILDLVDGCNYGFDCSKRELVRIEMLIDKFGKEKVRDAFSGAVTKLIEEEYFDVKYAVELPALDYSFSFPFSYEYENIDGKQVRKQPDMEAVLKQQPFYALLK